jgi:hypothetical protein
MFSNSVLKIDAFFQLLGTNFFRRKDGAPIFSFYRRNFHSGDPAQGTGSTGAPIGLSYF